MSGKRLHGGPLRFIDNGIFQKIFYLGAAGWMIVNNADKEILLIDPWPSFSKTRIKKNKSGIDRIARLSLWLRAKVAEQYKLTGILAGHEHYDHIDDIPWIISMLIDKSLTGAPPCKPYQLPPIYCDSGSKEKLEKSTIAEMDFIEFLDGNQKLYYDDVRIRRMVKKKVDGYPLVAGKAINKLQIGQFLVAPYIWDHSNTIISNSKYFFTPLSGHYQRTSAFLINRISEKSIPEKPKSTFIIGSGGEMCPRYTYNVCDTKIDSDILLQAVSAKAITTIFSWKRHLSKIIDYHVRNINTKMMILSHFERFVYKIDGPGKLERNTKVVREHVKILKKRLLSTDKEMVPVNIMERLCFEYDPEEIIL